MPRHNIQAPYSIPAIFCNVVCLLLRQLTPLDVGNIVNTSLPGLARLQAVELGDVARLDGEVVLPRIFGGEVLGAEDLGGPGVPYGGVGQGLGPVDGDARVAVVVENDWCHLCRAVDAVGLAGDGEGIRGLGDDGVVLRLVLVGGALQAGDGCCVDVLCLSLSVFLIIRCDCVNGVTYRNGEISVQKKLEVNGLGVRVLEAEVDVQVVLREVDRVSQLS